MPSLSQAYAASREGNIHLALSALSRKQIQSQRIAAQTFDVSRSTLARRRARKPARRDCQPNSRKLTQLEEEVIVKHILDLDLLLRMQLYVIWLISCSLRVVEDALG
jgi:hypothetical protein